LKEKLRKKLKLPLLEGDIRSKNRFISSTFNPSQNLLWNTISSASKTKALIKDKNSILFDKINFEF